MKNNFSNLTILYVEDEEYIRKNAVEYLGRICKKVLEAGDGFEAYKVYEKQKPDIIISDIQMPNLSGLELAKKIRKTDKSIPIIIATAHTQTEYLLKAVELQLVKYIVKPITSAKLKEALSLAYEHLSCSNIVKLDEKTTYDTLNKVLLIDDEVVKLTKNEQLLLELLVKNPQRAVTYKEIENLIWLDEGMSMDALRTLVRSLRKKLRGDFVENISGIGYRCSWKFQDRR
jgi:DNA-binding response OmpR family regulator